ncbi:MAG: carbohydrate kinase family protein [Chromatiales bacterium]|nr:carbohydrate kinase family protein [Chromatiales bacterium]
MSALICGSFAFDSIMVFPDRFRNHILPDQVHMLNVSFMVPKMRREFGGCAGNIAYNLKLLGGEGKPMGTVGTDFAPYAQWLDANGVVRDHVTEVDGFYTAQAFITTDQDDNQITAFHPGAMGEAHRNAVPTDAGITLGMVSPDGRQGMLDHTRQFAEAGIPFVFDPGQGLPMFNGTELLWFIKHANYIAVNDYEASLLAERTDLSLAQIAARCEAMIVTRGGEGSTIYAGKKVLQIPVAPIRNAADPTGCGDAYRAGLIYGLMNGMDWETTGRIAALIGAIKFESPGTQNHRFTRDEFHDRFVEAFEYSF